MMRALDMPMSKAELLNGFGVHLFRIGRYDLAEKKWVKCRNISNQYKLPWIKAIAEMNLSDIYSRKGKFRTAHDLLRRCEKTLKKINDLEGVSGVYFNRALVYAREGKIDEAYEFFERSEEFPLVYDNKRKERREVFNDCLRDKGYSPVRNPI